MQWRVLNDALTYVESNNGYIDEDDDKMVLQFSPIVKSDKSQRLTGVGVNTSLC